MALQVAGGGGGGARGGLVKRSQRKRLTLKVVTSSESQVTGGSLTASSLIDFLSQRQRCVQEALPQLLARAQGQPLRCAISTPDPRAGRGAGLVRRVCGRWYQLDETIKPCHQSSMASRAAH